MSVAVRLSDLFSNGTVHFFFFTVSATIEIYTLSLHDALPIYVGRRQPGAGGILGHGRPDQTRPDRKSTRLNSSHTVISYAVFCLKKKKILTARCDAGFMVVCVEGAIKIRKSERRSARESSVI